MGRQSYSYVIVGGGIAGAAAIEGIREVDSNGSISLFSAESVLPYNRPPLSKKLWQEDGTLSHEEILTKIQYRARDFYEKNKVDIYLEQKITTLDGNNRTITREGGETYHYDKLLLATGVAPRHLDVPGGDAPGVCYLRTLKDYEWLRSYIPGCKSALVIGGGFVGSEMAAALTMRGLNVSMIFPGETIGAHIFPPSLSHHLTEYYKEKGIKVLHSDAVTSIKPSCNNYRVQLKSGGAFSYDIIVVGIGAVPELELAKQACLETTKGIVVDDTLRTTRKEIYAAGDNTAYTDPVLGERHVEHWDNAVNQGKQAGRNMAGANERYTYIPLFYSDLFDFGFEAVGEVRSDLDVYADWQEPNKTGVIYYMKDGRVRGVMMCNVWDKSNDARTLIQSGEKFNKEALKGKIGEL